MESNLVGKSSVGLGLKQCLHSKLIPSSNLDCMLGAGGFLKGVRVGTGTEAFPMHPCTCPWWSVAISGFWHWRSEFFAVISNQNSVHFWPLAAFVQISDFLEFLDFRRSKSLGADLLYPLYFWLGSSFPVHPSIPILVTGLLPPEIMGTSPVHLDILFPLSGTRCPLLTALQASCP